MQRRLNVVAKKFRVAEDISGAQVVVGIPKRERDGRRQQQRVIEGARLLRETGMRHIRTREGTSSTRADKTS